MQRGFVGILVLAILVSAGIGYFVYSNYSNNRTGETPSPIASPSSPTDETANWKTYTNTKYGYSVSYPPQIAPKELKSDTYLSFISFEDLSDQNKQSLFSIEIRKSTLNEEINYQKWAASHIIATLKKETPITKDGYDGIKLEYVSSKPDDRNKGFTTLIINNGVYSYSLHFPTIDTDLIDQILSTFKFTDPSPSASCKPRPACLDATPRCLIPEPATGWCP